MQKLLSKLGSMCAVVGGQWGDEGKGKLIDILAGHFDVIVRATGGANAGHTIYLQGKKFVFHLIPAGMLRPRNVCVMGNGMVVHLPTLIEEMDLLEKTGVKLKGRLLLSSKAHLVLDYHKLIDRIQEERKGAGKVGTTGRGIGPAYTDKITRMGIRAGELKNFASFEAHHRMNVELLQKMYGFEYDNNLELKQIKALLPRILPLITDTTAYLRDMQARKKKILLEGANGTLLDIDHGTYPFVTSSNASIGGLLTGSGLSPRALGSALGIMKAYTTRVGSGPFPTELENEIGENIRQGGAEFGATTGRPRRCGWFDVPLARFAVKINGFSAINLTKVDVLNMLPFIHVGVAYTYKGKRLKNFPDDSETLAQCKVEYQKFPGWMTDISKAKTFQQLPKSCRSYITGLEKLIECPIRFIGTGKERSEMIVR